MKDFEQFDSLVALRAVLVLAAIGLFIVGFTNTNGYIEGQRDLMGAACCLLAAIVLELWK